MLSPAIGCYFRQLKQLSPSLNCSSCNKVSWGSLHVSITRRLHVSVSSQRCLTAHSIVHRRHVTVNKYNTVCCRSQNIFDSTYTGARLNSSAATTVTTAAAVSTTQSETATTSAFIEDPSFAFDAVSSITAAAEPTLSSLGLGLANWYPSGLVQAALESIHIGLDVPWWTSIVIGTICIRFAMFPLVILAQRNAVELQNNMPTMQRLQERMIAARRTGDHAGAMKASEELMQFMQRNKINPLKNMIVPMAQVPVFLSMYRALNGMAELPVASMQTGGLLWFADLTIQDPYYALPLMTVATLFATIEVGVDGIKANQMGNQQLKYFMRAMPVLVFPFIIHFPSAMLCYWFTSNAFSLVQVLFLKIPAVREFFKIPKMIDHGMSAPLRKYDVPKKGFIAGFRESFENMSLAAQMQQRQEANALKLKEAKKPATSTKSVK